MLKLLKKDFIETNKTNFILYIVTFVSSLIVLISSSYKDSIDALTATFVLCMGVSTLSMLVCLILPFVKSFLNNESIFKQDKKKIEKRKYDVKIISIILTVLLSFIVIGVSFVNTYSKNSIFKYISDLIVNKNQLKGVLIFGIDVFLKALILYFISLLSRIIAEEKESDKVLKTSIYTVLLVIITSYSVSFLVRVINVKRKFILKISLLILTNIILYIIGKYKYNKIIENK